MTGTAGPAVIGDRLDLGTLHHRFGDAATRRDPQACASLFTADGALAVHGCETQVGRGAIAAFLGDAFEGWEGLFFANLSGELRFPAAGSGDDHATGQQYVSEWGVRDGVAFDVSGVYHDVYRRQPGGAGGGWGYAFRRYRPLVVRRDGRVRTFAPPVDGWAELTDRLT